jgi:hypothetical protein
MISYTCEFRVLRQTLADGVLSAFVPGALSFFHSNADINDITWDFPRDILGFKDAGDMDFWNQLGYDFWANLDWTPEGQGLVKQVEELVGQENIGILTAPQDTTGCVDGKRAWIKKHLPKYTKQLVVTPAKTLFAAPKKILVDDHDPNITKFTKTPQGLPTGGSGVLIPRPWNSAKQRTDGKGGFDLTSIVSELRWAIRQTV